MVHIPRGWTSAQAPVEAVQVGDVIEAKVLGGRRKQSISLGMKHSRRTPGKYSKGSPVGSIVRAR